MKLLIASNQASLSDWVGQSLDDGDQVVHASADQVIEVFGKERFDGVLLELDSFESAAIEVIESIRKIATRRWIPIAILVSEIDEDKLSPVFVAGADDMVSSLTPPWLLKAKLRALARVGDLQSELQVAVDRIEQLSAIDGLTQLPNERGVVNELIRLYGQANRDNDPFAIVMFKINGFDRYEQENSASASQKLVQTLALLVEGSSSRPLDFVGRYKKDTLVLLLPSTANDGGDKVAQAALQHVRDAAIPMSSNASDGIVSLKPATMIYMPNLELQEGATEDMLVELEQSLIEQARPKSLVG